MSIQIHFILSDQEIKHGEIGGIALERKSYEPLASVFYGLSPLRKYAYSMQCQWRDNYL